MSTAPTRPLQQERPSDDGLQVMFIGEDRGLAELYRLKLELDGYWVSLSSTIDEGMEHMRTRMPDIVFLDLGAGDRVKAEDLGVLRRDEALQGVPVVLLSRRDMDVVPDVGVQLGSRDFLVRVDTVPGEEFWADTLHDPTHPRHI